MADKSPQQSLSRRRFLAGSAALVVTHSAFGAAQTTVRGAKPAEVLAYVGTYTSAVDGGGNGEGIYLFEMNANSGQLSNRKLAAKTPNPSWIVIHPSKKYLYAVNEVSDFHGNNGSVSAFTIEPETGDLRELNSASTEGAGPAYLSVDRTGKFAFVANYNGGSIAVLPILADGSLGSAVDIHRDSGFVGARRATHASPGSFAFSGHDLPHAHMVAPDPRNTFVLATDLGQDRIYINRLNSETGRLIPVEGTPFVALPSGDGPRHFVFHPNGHWLYTIQEEASTIAFFQYDPQSGSLTAQQTISTLPEGFAGTSFASEIAIAQDGRFL